VEEDLPDPVLEKCAAIASMVNAAESYPVDVLSTLSSSAEGILRIPKTQRHEFQHNIAKMIGEVLASVESSNSSKAAGTRAKLSQAESEKIVRTAALEAAVEHESALEGQVEQAQKALDESVAARKEAEKSVRSLGPELRKAAAEAEVADAEVAKCQQVLDAFRELESGVPTPVPGAMAEGAEAQVEVVTETEAAPVATFELPEVAEAAEAAVAA